MTVIRVSERHCEPNGSFGIRVAFDDEAEYDIQLADPGGLDTEKLLAWYFEEHLRFPFLDLDLECKAVAQLAEYGKALFGQVLGGAANHDYRNLRQRSFDDCRLEISGSTAFHLMHWEALRDPDMDMPLAMRLPITRRIDRQSSGFDLPSEQTTLNILVITARPFGTNDVGYRTISRPLLDVLRQSSLPVTVDLVRPGTWEALCDHLQSVKQSHGSGWYHIIHFDLHGALSKFADLGEQQHQGRLVFRSLPVKPFEGKRPFLFFETAHHGKAALVTAEEVANLLDEHRIPIAVLNACQSAMQGRDDASLAQQLVMAGIPFAVGMAYSITVSAVVQAMPILYEHLTKGVDPVEALHLARRSLYDSRERKAYFDQELSLEDWILPIAFRQRAMQARLRPMDEIEQASFFQRQADIALEPSTEYGFLGRDLDIQAIERRLLINKNANELLIQGMAGAGKSTLLSHLAWWWQRTGLVKQTFAYSYEDRAWTCGQIIRDIRSRLLTSEQHARAEAMTDTAQIEQVAQLLRTTRHLLILDNAESITATPAAIPHTIDRDEQAKLRNLLSRLSGSKTLVLIGSREAETWLAQGTFDKNIYLLPGLDPQAVSALLERILDRHHALGWLQDSAERQALQELVDLLGGYPLPMTVVLPTLATVAPSTVLTELKVGGTSADSAGRIMRAIEYSHGKLNPVLQASLLLLAPFTAVIPVGPALIKYKDLLQANEIIRDLGEIDLAAAIAEAVAVGLASPHPQLRDWVQVQPTLPYFLRSRLRQQDDLRIAVAQAHYDLYTQIGSEVWSLLVSQSDPRSRAAGRVVTEAEYANLTSALAHGLETGQIISGPLRLLEEYLTQTSQHDARRQLLDHAIANYPVPASELQHRELADLHNLAGITALSQRRLEDSWEHHQVELLLRRKTGDLSNEAHVYHQLGRVASERRQFEEAETSFRQAVRLFLQSGRRETAATTYRMLGKAVQAQGRFEEAEACYQKALKIFSEVGNRQGRADIYTDLGVLAQDQGRFEEAIESFRQALEIFLEFGELQAAAITYRYLADVLLHQGRLDDAEISHRNALEIFLKLGDRHGAALEHDRLALIAHTQGRLEEAEARHSRAIEIFLEFGDRRAAAIAHTQLGTIAEEQGRLDDAQAIYHQDLETFLEFGDLSAVAIIHQRLANVFHEQGRLEEAETSLRKALEILLESSDRRDTAFMYLQLGVLAREQGQLDDTRSSYLKALGIFQELGDKDGVTLVERELEVIDEGRGQSKVDQ